jgi:hypothetical protein
MSSPNASEFFNQIAETADQFRRQVAEVQTPTELYQGIAMLNYHLRQVFGYATSLASATRVLTEAEAGAGVPRCDKIIRPGQPWRCSCSAGHRGDCISHNSYTGPGETDEAKQ